MIAIFSSFRKKRWKRADSPTGKSSPPNWFKIMMHRFKIVVPSFNSVDYLPKTLHSIEGQTFKDYDVAVIDDGSTLKQQRQIVAEYCERNGWRAIYHETNRGALYGLVEVIAGFGCQDEDVIVVIDGDDWLAHEHVLERLHEAY